MFGKHNYSNHIALSMEVRKCIVYIFGMQAIPLKKPTLKKILILSYFKLSPNLAKYTYG
jgi:hypothetical protein